MYSLPPREGAVESHGASLAAAVLKNEQRERAIVQLHEQLGTAANVIEEGLDWLQSSARSSTHSDLLHSSTCLAIALLEDRCYYRRSTILTSLALRLSLWIASSKPKREDKSLLDTIRLMKEQIAVHWHCAAIGYIRRKESTIVLQGENIMQ